MSTPTPHQQPLPVTRHPGETQAAAPLPTPTSRQHPLRRFFLQLVIQFVILAVLYVLSIGPLFWQWYESYYLGESPFFALFYLPLLYACEIGPVGEAVNWYINLWI